MGPLLPFEIITQGWGLVIMFLIGLIFGAILEQSGFSSSKKLVGIFFAYDFVVLKVFFTAGITAMAGLFFMNYFGMIDINIIYINSNFLTSAIFGGVIMGFGFLIGGFCPGTSLPAAAIGKIDAMVFIAGMFIGIFLFGYFFDVFSKIQTGYYFDGEKMNDLLGISSNLFIVMMIIMAIAAFAVGEYFERKAPSHLKPTNKDYKGYIPEIGMAVLIGFLILVLPNHSPKRISEINQHIVLEDFLSETQLMHPDELAFRIMKKSNNFIIIDVRSREEFRQFHFENAINIPFEHIADKPSIDILRKFEDTDKILVSNGGVHAAKALILCLRMGIDNTFVLNGGLNQFVSNLFYNADSHNETTDIVKNSAYRFRQEAKSFFQKEK